MINGDSKPRVLLKIGESPMHVWMFRAVYVADVNGDGKWGYSP